MYRELLARVEVAMKAVILSIACWEFELESLAGLRTPLCDISVSERYICLSYSSAACASSPSA